MKKIKLNLTELKVNTFETTKPETNSGTVNGFGPQPTNPNEECKTEWGATCINSCPNSCEYSCLQTCEICNSIPGEICY